MTDVTQRVRDAFARRATTGLPLADDTNFFEAGYTSLRLAELVDELRSGGMDITLIDMFRYPTCRELTGALAERTGDRRTRDASRLPWQT